MHADDSMMDEQLLSALAQSAAWERLQLAFDIGGVADVLSSAASASVLVDDLVAAPPPVEEEVSMRFDELEAPTTLVGYDEVPEAKVVTRVMGQDEWPPARYR